MKLSSILVTSLKNLIVTKTGKATYSNVNTRISGSLVNP